MITTILLLITMILIISCKCSNNTHDETIEQQKPILLGLLSHDAKNTITAYEKGLANYKTLYKSNTVLANY